jgi:predicted nucleotidyltransferase
MRSSGSVRIFWPPFSRDELIARLREHVPALAAALPIKRVVLFGSWAQGRATVRSDIDVLVVYSGPRRDDAFRLVKVDLGTPGVEPHVYTEEEAESIRDTLDRMTKCGVVLFPPE